MSGSERFLLGSGVTVCVMPTAGSCTGRERSLTLACCETCITLNGPRYHSQGPMLIPAAAATQGDEKLLAFASFPVEYVCAFSLLGVLVLACISSLVVLCLLSSLGSCVIVLLDALVLDP